MNEFDHFVFYFIMVPILIFTIAGFILKLFCWIMGIPFEGSGKNDGEGDYGF